MLELRRRKTATDLILRETAAFRVLAREESIKQIALWHKDQWQY